MDRKCFADEIRYQRMSTQELRESFLVDKLFQPNVIDLCYTDADRAIVGSAVPGAESLRLATAKYMASDYFAERREIGVINIGQTGSITVDGEKYNLDHRDGLYIGRGNKEILFSSENAAAPARFYILSYPAHTEFPTTHIKASTIDPVQIGVNEEANARAIYKYIHLEGVRSCQLVMGLTELQKGSIWNTMPAHTHDRRTEIYMYFDLGKDDLAFHFMGMPDETRHIVIRNQQAVLSPGWSIHCGAGTSNYTFIWGMGGENQDYGDMDMVGMKQLL